MTPKEQDALAALAVAFEEYITAIVINAMQRGDVPNLYQARQKFVSDVATIAKEQ